MRRLNAYAVVAALTLILAPAMAAAFSYDYGETKWVHMMCLNMTSGALLGTNANLTVYNEDSTMFDLNTSLTNVAPGIFKYKIYNLSNNACYTFILGCEDEGAWRTEWANLCVNTSTTTLLSSKIDSAFASVVGALNSTLQLNISQVPEKVWAYATRILTGLDEDDTTIDLDGTTIGTVTVLSTWTPFETGIGVFNNTMAGRLETLNASITSQFGSMNSTMLSRVEEGFTNLTTQMYNLNASLRAYGDANWATATGFTTASDLESLNLSIRTLVYALNVSLQAHGDAGWTTAAGFATPDHLKTMNATIQSNLSAVLKNFSDVEVWGDSKWYSISPLSLANLSSINNTVKELNKTLQQNITGLWLRGDSYWYSTSPLSLANLSSINNTVKELNNTIILNMSNILVRIDKNFTDVQAHGDANWATSTLAAADVWAVGTRTLTGIDWGVYSNWDTYLGLISSLNTSTDNLNLTLAHYASNATLVQWTRAMLESLNLTLQGNLSSVIAQMYSLNLSLRSYGDANWASVTTIDEGFTLTMMAPSTIYTEEQLGMDLVATNTTTGHAVTLSWVNITLYYENGTVAQNTSAITLRSDGSYNSSFGNLSEGIYHVAARAEYASHNTTATSQPVRVAVEGNFDFSVDTAQAGVMGLPIQYEVTAQVLRGKSQYETNMTCEVKELGLKESWQVMTFKEKPVLLQKEFLLPKKMELRNYLIECVLGYYDNGVPRVARASKTFTAHKREHISFSTIVQYRGVNDVWKPALLIILLGGLVMGFYATKKKEYVIIEGDDDGKQ